MHKQTHIDSLMETVINTLIGFIIALITTAVVFPLYGIKTHLHDQAAITGIFTIVSILRQYILRRLFNGRTVWWTIREYFQNVR